MSFQGVDLSLAGVVVLALAIMRSEVLEIVLRRRVWKLLTGAAALAFLGVGYVNPPAFQEGLTRAGHLIAEEVRGPLDEVLHTSTTPPTPDLPK